MSIVRTIGSILLCGGLVLLAPVLRGAADLRIIDSRVVVNGGYVVVVGQTQLSSAAATLTVEGALWSTGGLAAVEGSTLRLTDASGRTEAIEIAGSPGERTFAGTITDAAGGPGGIFIEGGDAFTLSGANTYTGVTVVENATLLVNNASGSGTGTGALIVMNGGELGGSGRVGGSVLIESGGGVRPDMTLTFDAAVVLQGDVNLDLASAATESLLAAGELDIGSATLNLSTSNLTESAYLLARYGSLTGGMFGSIIGLPAGYLIDYAFNDGSGSNHIALVLPPPPSAFATWAENAGLTVDVNDGFADDPNRDGVSNGAHFAFGTDPLAVGPGNSPIRVDLLDDGDGTYLTLTLPVRNGASFTGAESAPIDGITYSLLGDDDLSGADIPVVERSLAWAVEDLPAIGESWEYRSFRLTVPSDSSSQPQAFLWGAVTDVSSSVVAQTATYGGTIVDVLAGSDSYWGVPLRAATGYEGELESAVTSGDGVQLALSGRDAFPRDGWANHYYVRFRDGAHAGEYYTITANEAGTVTVDTLGGDLAGLQPGDGVGIAKYTTLADLLPPETQDSIISSTGNFPFQRKSELLFPDLTGVGVKRAPSRIFYIAGGQWRESKAGFPAADDVVVLPEQFVILRQPATAGSRTLRVTGVVEAGTVASFVFTEADQDNDNYFTQSRPVPVSLAQLSLEGAFTASTGNFPFQRRDELLVWDNEEQAQKKAPSRIYYRVGSNWRESVAGFPTRNDLTLAPGAAFAVRRKADGSGGAVSWVQPSPF